MATDNRRIIYVSMDAFYVSIEQLDKPELKDKPVVLGSSDKRIGVVTSPNYKAQKAGVSEAEATRSAKKKCPRLVILPPRPKLYKKYASKVRVILKRYASIIEEESLSTYFLDVTEPQMDLTTAIMIAERIQEDIQAEMNLTSSMGIACNKFLAKVAGKWSQPDGLTAILPQNTQPFVDDLPAEKFSEITKANARKMTRLKLSKGIDLREMKKKDLILQFGSNGLIYHDLSRGIDPRPVQPTKTENNILVEKSYIQPLNDQIDVLAEIEKLNREFVKKIPSEGIKDLRLTLRDKNYKTTPRRLHYEQNLTKEADIKAQLTIIFNEIYQDREINMIRITTTTTE